MAEENAEATILGEQLEQTESVKTEGTQQADMSAQADQHEVDYLSDLVGEGKKYTSIEEAAKSLAKKAVHADQFIEILKREKQDLEEQVGSSKKIDDIMALLGSKQDPASEPKTATPTQEKPKDGEDVRSAVERLLKEKEDEAKQKEELEKIKSNQQKSWELLSESFGSLDNAKIAVKEYIGGDSVKAEVVNQLGSYKPEELANFIKAQKTSVTPTSSAPSKLNTSEFNIGSGKELTWSKAREIKKENPKLYKSHKFQQLLHATAAQNPNFFDE